MTALATFRGRLIVAFALAITGCAQQHTESVVVVQDRGKVDLASFQCQNDTRSGFITRVCYDSGSRRMLIGFQGGTYKQYCGVDVKMADALLSAPSMGKFYATKIRGNSKNGRFDCGAHR